jgi:hypothetical protein
MRNHLGKASVAQSLDGEPSGGEPAFPRTANDITSHSTGCKMVHPDAGSAIGCAQSRFRIVISARGRRSLPVRWASIQALLAAYLERAMDGTTFASHAMSPSRIGRRAALWLGAAACLLHATGAVAQDEPRIRAGLEIWRSSGCPDCHGPFADGDRDDDDFPQGANLRTTRLDDAGIKQTINCGRPGTGMPSFDAGAYTVRPCYGRPPGGRPDNLQPTPRTLSLDEIDALVAYLQARIVSHGKVTREECLFYYEGKADCDDVR